jgi:cytochrome P450
MLYSIFPTDIIPIMKNLVKQHGSPFAVWLGPKLYVITDNPDDVQILLNAPNSMHKDEVYDFMNCFGLNAAGLISSSGETWKNHRKLLNPCFAPKVLESYTPIFNKCGRILTRNLNQLAEKGDKFDVLDSMLACSLDLVVETSMGMQLNCQDGNNGQFLLAVER